MNYAIYGPKFKSFWIERGWAGNLIKLGIKGQYQLTLITIVLSATILTIMNIFSTKATMKMMGFLTCVKLFILSLIAIIGILVLAKIIPSDVDHALNLSFYGTSNTVGPYASALYYVMNSYSGWHNLNYILDEVKVTIYNYEKKIRFIKMYR